MSDIPTALMTQYINSKLMFISRLNNQKILSLSCSGFCRAVEIGEENLSYHLTKLKGVGAISSFNVVGDSLTINLEVLH